MKKKLYCIQAAGLSQQSWISIRGLFSINQENASKMTFAAGFTKINLKSLKA